MQGNAAKTGKDFSCVDIVNCKNQSSLPQTDHDTVAQPAQSSFNELKVSLYTQFGRPVHSLCTYGFLLL